jgi:hypothetical protein
LGIKQLSDKKYRRTNKSSSKTENRFLDSGSMLLNIIQL